MLLRLTLIMIAVLVLACSPRHSTASSCADNRNGYWWYCAEPETEKKEEEQPKEQQKQPKTEAKTPSMPKRTLPKLADYTYEQLWQMHPDDFQELLTEFHKKAITTLAPADVEEYAEMQNMARQRANAFGGVYAAVMQKKPEMNLTLNAPSHVKGTMAQTTQRSNDVTTRLNQARSNFALLYFYAENCPYCEQQNPIMQMFQRRNQWEMRAFDKNRNPEMAARFGVTVTPTIILIVRGDTGYYPISYGVIPLDSLEDKLYRTVRLMSGEVTPEQFYLFESERGQGFDPLAPSQYWQQRSQERRNREE